MKENLDTAKQASSEIESYLWTLPNTVNVINVEDDEFFRKADVDLLWVTPDDVLLVEIKGDRQYKTGNYFFETTSNIDNISEGCFMYTKADLIFYYFVEQKELHILPTEDTRQWFIRNMDRFKTKTTSTKINNDKYYSFGKIVPRKTVQKEVKTVKVLSLTNITMHDII